MKTLLSLVVIAGSVLAQPKVPKGHLVIVGGGGTPEAVIRQMLALAGGPQARVATLPQASARKDAAERSRQFWVRAGARHITVVDVAKPKLAIRALEQATLIWMPGGSQSRLMDAIGKNGLVDVVRRRHAEGAVVGGTSAGAAVMSNPMIARGGKKRSLDTDGVTLGKGLGLWPDVIVDQHFTRRRRLPRLIAAVLQDPRRIGVGIDERTAVKVSGGVFEVLGENAVTVLDARRASKRPAMEGHATPPAWGGLVLHILRPGSRFDPRAGRFVKGR